MSGKIDLVYSARNSRELAERYDFWAPDYDQDLERLGYIGPWKGAEMLARHAARNARVLDAGAGTGLVGQALQQLGYRNLTGLDASAGMLARARMKMVYQELHLEDLGGSLSFAADSFEAVVSIGVFTYGHAPAACLHELIRVTCPGGHIVFSLRPDFYTSSDFRKTLDSLVVAGHWELVEVSPEFRCFLKDGSDAAVRLWAYEVRK